MRERERVRANESTMYTTITTNIYTGQMWLIELTIMYTQCSLSSFRIDNHVMREHQQIDSSFAHIHLVRIASWKRVPHSVVQITAGSANKFDYHYFSQHRWREGDTDLILCVAFTHTHTNTHKSFDVNINLLCLCLNLFELPI